MNRRRRAVGAALLGAMLQLTASVAVAAEVVVCRAPGGHVEIESVLDDCCPPGEASRGARELRDDACDGCLDTPLLQAGLSTPAKATLDALVPARWSLASVPTLLRVSGGAPPLAAAAARRSRTVVLLI